jgi:hypothetical protein
MEEDNKDKARVVNMRSARAGKPTKAKYKKIMAD